MRSVRSSMLLVSVFLVSPSAVRAEGTGAVSGRVTDPTGAPLPGVTVEAKAAAGGRAPVTRSDGDGRYEFAELREGVYELSFRVPGFATTVLKRVEVAAGRTTPLDATLTLALTTQVVVTAHRTFRDLSTVSAAEDVIGIAGAASNGVIAASQLENRSNQRPGALLERVPGIVVSQHSGEGKANQYYVRGFNIDHGTDLAISVAGVPVNLPTHGHGQG